METIYGLLHKLYPQDEIKCLKLYGQNLAIMNSARGSSHNHQDWIGGYMAHVRQVMTLAEDLYPVLSVRHQLPFSLQDALLVLFLHDLEKPWKNTMLFASKEDKRKFRASKIVEYDIELSDQQLNALRYVEGEGDDYSPTSRVMNELAAFCHMCDVASARIWHSKE